MISRRDVILRLSLVLPSLSLLFSFTIGFSSRRGIVFRRADDRASRERKETSFRRDNASIYSLAHPSRSLVRHSPARSDTSDREELLVRHVIVARFSARAQSRHVIEITALFFSTRLLAPFIFSLFFFYPTWRTEKGKMNRSRSLAKKNRSIINYKSLVLLYNS